MYSPPRRGGVARQPAGWRAGVVSSANRFGRSFIKASPYRARASRHPVCAFASLSASTPHLRGGECLHPLRPRAAAAGAAAFTKGRIRAWMEHLSIKEKVQKLSCGLCEFRIRIEGMRHTFESVELHRDLHLAEFLEQTFTTLDWNSHVRGSMENYSWG